MCVCVCVGGVGDICFSMKTILVRILCLVKMSCIWECPYVFVMDQLIRFIYVSACQRQFVECAGILKMERFVTKVSVEPQF